MDLSDYRKDYLKGGLHRADLAATPEEQFTLWFQQAIDAGYPEPNAMSLATVAATGAPSLRTVLLKYFNPDGMVFFTNYTSRKAKEIDANPNVSLLFPWVTLERQVIVIGKAEKISAVESLKYFTSRPHESQLGAWVSAQSEVISNRKLLQMKLAEIGRKFKEGKVPLPDFWGGYRVVPHHVEFWQGGSARLHDRLLYTRESSDADWQVNRLSP
jgi:pyridoxamine 5'-phosphate oxidase